MRSGFPSAIAQDKLGVHGNLPELELPKRRVPLSQRT